MNAKTSKYTQVSSTDMVGQGMQLAMDEIYKAILGPGVNSLARRGDATQMSPLDWISLATMGIGTGAVAQGAQAANRVANTARQTFALDRSAIHSSKNPNLIPSSPADFKSGNNRWGPGTYFYDTPEQFVFRGGKDYGENAYQIKHTPISAIKTATSKGYLNALDSYDVHGVLLPGADLDRVEKLRKMGYIGVREPNTGILTNWTVGAKGGPKLKKIDAQKKVLESKLAKKPQ